VRLLVAGGAGFIGSAYARRRLAERPGDSIAVLDKLTYAGRRENLRDLPENRVELIEGDIADPDAVAAAIEGCDAVINFAAESHVDRSIHSPGEFITTDVFGSFVLLEAAREAGIRHLQISTDEVYGSIEDGSFSEDSPLGPSSPYAASKGGGDLLVQAYHRTYGADALICRSSNNYGPGQHPEKLIPLCILNALAGDPLPVYGDGLQVRNWLYVEDNCAAIDLVLERGRVGEIYNVGGPDELPNLEVVRMILELTGRDESLIEHVSDRPGHDRRYSLDSAKVSGLGWEPRVRFAEGLERTVAWYRDNAWWWEPIRSGEYRGYYERQYGRPLSGGPREVAT
jgi:dTDP-glucose 4,6-dehydratase